MGETCGICLGIVAAAVLFALALIDRLLGGIVTIEVVEPREEEKE